MGGIKYIKDGIEGVEVQTIEDVEQSKTIWMYKRNDWVDMSTGELLTGYEPTEQEYNYSKRIRYFADLKNTT
jgi:hypothetical protein